MAYYFHFLPYFVCSSLYSEHTKHLLLKAKVKFSLPRKLYTGPHWTGDCVNPGDSLDVVLKR
jgi:hypothetical protein